MSTDKEWELSEICTTACATVWRKYKTGQRRSFKSKKKISCEPSARSFRIHRELETQRAAKGDYSAELQARHRRVVNELHASQELAQIFDKKNQQLQGDNQKLADQLRTREDDRQALLKELVLARREVNRLKQQLNENPTDSRKDLKNLKEKTSPKVSEKTVNMNRLQCSRNATYERELKYRDAINRLKKMYEMARKEQMDIRKQLDLYMQQRTELEILLQASLDDVKMEIVRKEDEDKKATAWETVSSPTLPKISNDQKAKNVTAYDLAGEDRERVLGTLLSQKRVVELLYSKCFPKKPTTPPEEEAPEDFSWLESVLAPPPM